MYKETKRPLQSYSSAKSLKKNPSKGNLKRQSSSPYLQLADTSNTSHSKFSKISRSKSPKRKNKSLDNIKLKNSGSVLGIRPKLGATLESMKKSTTNGDYFSRLNQTSKKDK